MRKRGAGDTERKSIVIFGDNFFVQRWHHFASVYLPRGLLARNDLYVGGWGMQPKTDEAAIVNSPSQSPG